MVAGSLVSPFRASKEPVFGIYVLTMPQVCAHQNRILRKDLMMKHLSEKRKIFLVKNKCQHVVKMSSSILRSSMPFTSEPPCIFRKVFLPIVKWLSGISRRSRRENTEGSLVAMGRGRGKPPRAVFLQLWTLLILCFAVLWVIQW